MIAVNWSWFHAVERCLGGLEPVGMEIERGDSIIGDGGVVGTLIGSSKDVRFTCRNSIGFFISYGVDYLGKTFQL